MNLERTSVLALGSKGKYGKKSFVLAGRTCIRSKSGNVWNEHRMLFDDGSEATLAEAMGAFTIFVVGELPALAGLDVGDAKDDFVVVERGKGKRVESWGEPFEAPAKFSYVDLSSRTGQPATIDVTDETSYLGTPVTLAALGLAPRPEPPTFFPAPKSKAKLTFAIGTEGMLAKTSWRIIGALGRSVKDDGERFSWTEYVLHDAEKGFRWLVELEDQFLFVEMIPPGLVVDREESAVFGGATYAWSSGGTARLDWAAGEFPWEAEIGDKTTVHDFEHGAQVLSFEGTRDEIAWSRGRYLTHSEVTSAFNTASRR